jgi:hypothetical protein
MEEYLESQGSFEGDAFCVDINFWENLMLDNLIKKNIVVVKWRCIVRKVGVL